MVHIIEAENVVIKLSGHFDLDRLSIALRE